MIRAIREYFAPPLTEEQQRDIGELFSAVSEDMAKVNYFLYGIKGYANPEQVTAFISLCKFHIMVLGNLRKKARHCKEKYFARDLQKSWEFKLEELKRFEIRMENK